MLAVCNSYIVLWQLNNGSQQWISAINGTLASVPVDAILDKAIVWSYWELSVRVNDSKRENNEYGNK